MITLNNHDYLIITLIRRSGVVFNARDMLVSPTFVFVGFVFKTRVN